jgi:hypothetical protein
MGAIFGKVMTEKPQKMTRLCEKICLDHDDLYFDCVPRCMYFVLLRIDTSSY